MHTRHWQPPVHVARYPCIRDLTASLAAAMRTGFLASILIFTQSSLAFAQQTEPSTELTPGDVVRVIVESLRNNDASNDAGIATVFRFASPVNKLKTGPLPRFRSMIKEGFPDMLNHIGARYDPMEIAGDTALQAVWLMTPSGKEVGYAFQLSRQSDDEYVGMWMTDSVIPLGKGSRSGTRI